MELLTVTKLDSLQNDLNNGMALIMRILLVQLLKLLLSDLFCLLLSPGDGIFANWMCRMRSYMAFSKRKSI